MGHEVKRIIVLANSYKTGGRCIAGKEIVGCNPGQWVRPVAPANETKEGALDRKHRRTADGSEPQVLNEYEVTFAQHRPGEVQPENWDVVPGEEWRHVRSWPAQENEQLLDKPQWLWGTGKSATPQNLRDNKGSLFLIQPESFEPYSTTSYGKPQIRAKFRYNFDYDLPIKDPLFTINDWTEDAEAGVEGKRPVWLCVSLTAPFFGECYKLIASVIELS